MIYFGSWDCHLYAVDIKTRKEVWRFTTSTTDRAWRPPPHECFETELKIPKTDIDSSEVKNAYRTSTFGAELFGQYKSDSPYKTKSEYKRKSEYR
jgi:hypothetical protein